MAFINVINVASYGILPTPATGTANSLAWEALMERTVAGVLFIKDGDIIQFNEGIYDFARTMVVNRVVVITGKWAANYADTAYTTLRFLPNITGMKLLAKSSVMQLKMQGGGWNEPPHRRHLLPSKHVHSKRRYHQLQRNRPVPRRKRVLADARDVTSAHDPH